MQSSDFGKSHLQQIPSGGRLRDYLLRVPRASSQRLWPLLIALHGAGSDARGMEQFSGLSQLVDDHGICVVYPNGTGRTASALTWNAGGKDQFAARAGIDDVGFIRDLMEHLGEEFPLDKSRVYVVGMSNGAAMAYRLAVEIPERLAGIAAVGGCMPSDLANPSRPVPVIHFHGTEDTFVPFAGGIGRGLSRTPMHSVDRTIAIWVAVNHTLPTPDVVAIAEKVTDGTSVLRSQYQAQQGGADVVLYTIYGGGHTWPGRPSTMAFLGPVTGNVDATARIWEFFMQSGTRGPGKPTSMR